MNENYMEIVKRDQTGTCWANNQLIIMLHGSKLCIKLLNIIIYNVSNFNNNI